ncbi:F-box only protein 43 [Cricetulus griseus]|uniref:F-box only protein 43 n=1 Tax=Cricetulus griseus TaxID=10029 RepID=G3HU71_CRIGR|nr:F-box only protein 43 [Cricetulus griseus]
MFPRKEKGGSPELCETPKARRKPRSLRRRLDLSFTLLKADSDPQSASLESSVSRVLSPGKHTPDSASSFPKQDTFSPSAASTVDTEDATSRSQSCRLSFSQHKTSTIDDSAGDCGLFEVECLSPIRGDEFKGSATHDFSDSSLSVSDENTCPELLGFSGGSQTSSSGADVTTSVTPVSSLMSKIRFKGSQALSSSSAEARDSVSTPEDSGFSSLTWDKSEDSLSDQEGSLQELLQKHRGTPRAGDLIRKPKHPGRQRRLSTLREQGSQSETEDEKQMVPPKAATGTSGGQQRGPGEKNPTLDFKNLSNTPALQLVHELFVKSKRKRFPQADGQEFLEERDEGTIGRLQCVLAGLIGKKMGIEQLDILTELQYRNLKHVLAVVLASLTSESLYSAWNVSRNWREIVAQDKKANERRKLYIIQLKADAQATVLHVQEAGTRLRLLSRSALRSVQAQAQAQAPPSQKEQAPTLSPWGDVFTPVASSSLTHLRSKQDQYVKTFSEAIRFNVDYGVFEVVNNAPQLLEKQLKRILQSQKPRNPIYDVIRKGKSDAKPFRKNVPREDETINITYTIMCLNREQESLIYEDGVHPRTIRRTSKMGPESEEEEEGSISIKDSPSQALLRIYREKRVFQEKTLHFANVDEFLNAYIIFILREAMKKISDHSLSSTSDYTNFYNISRVVFDKTEPAPSKKAVSSPPNETADQVSEEKLEKVSLSSKSESTASESRADWCISHRTYDIGNRKEFERFKKFLKGTSGERYWWLWMDIERLKVLKDQGRHQRHLEKMKKCYLLSSGELYLSTEILSKFKLLHGSLWTEEHLKKIQIEVLKPLLLYCLKPIHEKGWLPSSFPRKESASMVLEGDEVSLFQQAKSPNKLSRVSTGTQKMGKSEPLYRIPSKDDSLEKGLKLGNTVVRLTSFTDISECLKPQLERRYTYTEEPNLWKNSVYFWFDLQAYHQLFYQDTLHPFKVCKQAQYLFATYIAPSATLDIGLDPEERKDIYLRIQPPFEDLFDTAEEYILLILLEPWTQMVMSDQVAYAQVELQEETRQLDSTYFRKLHALHKEAVLKKGEDTTGSVAGMLSLSEISKHMEYWSNVPEEYKNFTFNDLLNNKLEFEHFRQFLESHSSREADPGPAQRLACSRYPMYGLAADESYQVSTLPDLCHSHCDESIIQQKITTIINCFINSCIPPALQIDIPIEQAQKIIEHRKELGPYVFREAQMTIFGVLFKFWPQFCEFRKNLTDEKIMSVLERRQEYKQKKKLSETDEDKIGKAGLKQYTSTTGSLTKVPITSESFLGLHAYGRQVRRQGPPSLQSSGHSDSVTQQREVACVTG